MKTSGHYENLTTRKNTSRGILAGILTKTSETSKLTPKYMLNISKTHDCELNLSPIILLGFVQNTREIIPLFHSSPFDNTY